MDYLESLPATAYTRSHVADFLVQQQVVKSRQKSFKSHLGKRGKIYVASAWCSLQDAVATINKVGGLAVLAHPGRYPLNTKKLEILAQDFKACGGVGIEGSYPNIDPNMMKRLELLARQEGLLLSTGSDFHDPAARWTALGKFPRLGQAAQAIGVWTHPIWRAQIA
jgi:predicted metal-dependent phosphoesterase TrpH